MFRCNIKIVCVLWLVTVFFMEPVASHNLAQQQGLAFTTVRQLLEQGRFKDALQEAQTIYMRLSSQTVSPDIGVAEAHFWIGKCYAALVERDAAMHHLDSALLLLKEKNNAFGYSIEIQIGLIRVDSVRIGTAIAYFSGVESKDESMLAEAHLALGYVYLRKNENNKAWRALQQSLVFFQSTGESSASEGLCFQFIGYHHCFIEKQYDLALENFQKARDIFIRNGGTESNYLASLYANMGACLDYMGLPRKAVGLFAEAENNFQKQNPQHPALLNVYNNTGNSYADLGDYTLSIRYLEKAIELAAPNNGRYWNNLGDAYLKKGDDSLAEKCFDASLPLLLSEKKVNFSELARPYHNLGIIYRNRGDINRALEYELRSLPYRKSDPKAFLDIARSYHGVGECYIAQKRYDKALIYLDSALQLQLQAIPSHLHAELALTYLAKARCLAGLKDFRAALMLNDSALYACCYAGQGKFGDAIAPPELLTALALRGTLLYQYYLQTKEEGLLAAAEMAFDTGALAIRYFRNTLFETESKSTLVAQFRNMLSGGVTVALDMHRIHPEDQLHIQRAFAFTEQSKALVLLEGVRSAGVTRFEGVSDSILEEERMLRRAITDAEILLRELLSNPLSHRNSLIKAKNELFDRQSAYEDFQRNLASGSFANYYNYRFGFSLATIADVQSQLLSKDQTLLSYFIKKDSQIIAFVIQKDGFKVVECPVEKDLEKWVVQLNDGLTGYHTLDPSKQSEELYEKKLLEYIAAAQQLYNCLLLPVEHLLGSKVIIVPDGLLGAVPFELLLTGPPPQIRNFATYPYWFTSRKHFVGYAYSATLQREMVQKQHRKKPLYSFMGMAPFFPGTRTDVQKGTSIAALRNAAPPKPEYKHLFYSGKEVLTVSDLWAGQYWVGKEASKDNFLKKAPDYRILYLSTHGVLDNAAEFSYLAFATGTSETESLYVRDLYNIQLNTDLVTLSACETGIGEIEQGEGIISLSRAFAYAGAKSIVTSLWQVDDIATKDLMVGFYRNLKSGNTKDAALAKAKSDYISNPRGAQNHPFFWGGFIGIGDMQTIQNQ